MAKADQGKRRRSQVRERIREQHRAAYREAILEAAERLFAARGISGVRMSDLAAEAGLATGTLYNYFPSKGEVFRSLLMLRGSDMIRSLQECYEREREPIPRLAAMVQAAFAGIERHRAGYKMLTELTMPEATLRRFGGRELLDLQGQYLALFEKAMSDAVESGRIRDTLSSADLTSFLVGAMDAIARAWSASNEGSSLAAKASLVIELFLSGASTKP